MREPEDNEASHATHEGLPSDIAEEPAHTHVLHLHQGETADGTDTQHIASCHYAVSDYLPVETVGIIHRIHDIGRIAQSHHIVQ